MNIHNNLYVTPISNPLNEQASQPSNQETVERIFGQLSQSGKGIRLHVSGKLVEADPDRVAYIGNQEISLTMKKERLLRAKELLKTAELLFANLGTLKEDQKLDLVNTLKKAYKIFHQEDLFNSFPHDAARLLFMYGRKIYGAEMSNCRQIMQASLALSFGLNVDFLNKTDNLENLPTLLKESKELDFFITDLLDTPKFLELFALVPEKTKFNVALTHRWLGHALQNIPEANGKVYKETSPAVYQEMRGEVADFFSRYYNNTLQAYKAVKGIDTSFEELETRYNSERFIMNTREDNQVDKAIDSLQEIENLATKDSLEHKRLRSQIVNARTLEKNKKRPSAENKAELALFIWEQYQDVAAISKMALQTPGFDRFLATMYLSNKFKWALDARKNGFPVISDAELKIISILLYARIKKSEDHVYFPYFYNGLADYENTVQQNRAAALSYLQLADEMNIRMNESDEDQQAFRLKHNLQK